MDFWHTLEIRWYDEPHTHCISSVQYSRESSPLMSFLKNIFVKKLLTLTCIQTFTDQFLSFSFKLVMMIEATKLYILKSVWMTLTFIQGHSCMKNQKLWCPYSRRFMYQFGLNSVCRHNLLVYWSSCKIKQKQNKKKFPQIIFKGGNCANVIYGICI